MNIESRMVLLNHGTEIRTNMTPRCSSPQSPSQRVYERKFYYDYKFYFQYRPKLIFTIETSHFDSFENRG